MENKRFLSKLKFGNSSMLVEVNFRECHEAQKEMTAVSQSFIVAVLSNSNPQYLSFV